MDGELVSPEGTQKGKKTCHLAAIRLQPLLMVSSDESQDVKTQDVGSRELKCLSKEISVSLHIENCPIP